MALNDASVLSGNGQTSTPVTKRKSARKAPTTAKRASTRTAVPQEILFTQEPNPFREPVPPYIWIDFPLQNEVLNAPVYVIRMGVGGADLVEMSIDKSAWLPCRLTSGYWWFDWSKIAKGKHTLVARMRTPDGRWFKTPPRLCDYK